MTWWTAIDTERVSDSGSSNTVLVVSLALVVLGLALLVVTVWFWRLTRPDPDALGPLAVMSDRDFWRRGPIEQRRSLDAARPGMMVIAEPDVDDSEIDVESGSDPVPGDAEIDVTSEPQPEIHEPELSWEPEPDPEPEIVDEVMAEIDDDPVPETRPRSIDPLL